MHPGAERRELAVEHMTARVKLRLGSMIVVGGPHRTHNSNVIDATAHMWNKVAQLNAARAIRAIADLQRITRMPQLDVEGDFTTIESLGILCVGIRRIKNRFA